MRAAPPLRHHPSGVSIHAGPRAKTRQHRLVYDARTCWPQTAGSSPGSVLTTGQHLKWEALHASTRRARLVVQDFAEEGALLLGAVALGAEHRQDAASARLPHPLQQPAQVCRLELMTAGHAMRRSDHGAQHRFGSQGGGGVRWLPGLRAAKLRSALFSAAAAAAAAARRQR